MEHLAEKVMFLRLLKNAQMQCLPAFAEAASRRQANILRAKELTDDAYLAYAATSLPRA